MLDAIKSFFSQNIEPAAEQEQESGRELEIAACALLLEIAHVDDEFSEQERKHIDSILARHFDLDEETVSELIELADAERAQAVDLFQFTRLVSDRFDHAQKMVLVEAMWGVVFSDGEMASHEVQLMRRVSHLLGVEPGYLSEARKRVAKRVGKVDQG